MANMRLMKEGFLDLAIVQSDILAEAAYGTGDFEGSRYPWCARSPDSTTRRSR